MRVKDSQYFLINNAFSWSEGEVEWWFRPAALLIDLASLPVWAGVDICYQGFINVLVPIGNTISRIFNIAPKGVLEFMAKSTVFIVPSAVLGFMIYMCYSFASGRSVSADAHYIKDSLASMCESVVSPKVVAGFVAGVFIGSKFCGSQSQER